MLVQHPLPEDGPPGKHAPLLGCPRNELGTWPVGGASGQRAGGHRLRQVHARLA